ncbi:MAG: hypothetical protein RL391_1145 [Actinomycetota bacterium]|jgi:hypothetical protein
MMSREEAARLLGVELTASSDLVRMARRRLALHAHPDRGGDPVEMSRINAACDVLLAPHQSDETRTNSSQWRGSSVDRPSFVIDRLPAEAFEYLQLAARTLGEIVDDDPPYMIEVVLEAPRFTWCRLEIVPDAGASTVSIISDEETEATDLCSVWVSAVNELSLDADH